MAFNPTPSQELAINQKGNILVSAAAGSGKTAVLVERVISMLCDKDSNVSADELLIVTFTNAAALEMRSRIEKRIDQEVANNPHDTALLLQKHLLSNAKICTIDSFCIDLVRENFDKLGVSPDFKIGESSELKAINEQVIYSIINRYFEEKDPLFLQLLDIIGSEFDEKNFAELVLSVYEYSRQMPFPIKWYDSILSNFGGGVFSKENIWYSYAFEKAQKTIKSMLSYITNAIELITTVEKASNSYLSVFSDAKRQIEHLKEKADIGNWDEFYESLNEYKLMRLPSVRGMSDYPEINAAKDIYKHLGGKALDTVYKFFYADFNFINNQFKKLYPALELFVKILKEFDDKVFEEYKENNIFTFHNTEHLALKLLCVDENTQTKYAKEILSQYKEILVDEYQDTNDLQNMLFYVLSDNERKLFVVGDVKQSIYAFRGANPLNFLKKKNDYIPILEAGDKHPKKIILGNNFRSKDQICEFTNYFFSLFMQKETGNIIYSDEEFLIPTSVFPKTDDLAVSAEIIDKNGSDIDTVALEAQKIANFIKNTMTGKPCIKVDNDTLRKAEFGDFTILFRNLSTNASAFVTELKKQGIPVNLNLSDLSNSTEISTFLSLLRVIDNPQNDIELLTLMSSPIFAFSENDLAVIRAKKKNGNLYSAVIFSANLGDEKCKNFLSKIEEFRLDSVTLSPDKLVLKLLISTEFLNIVSSMPNGEQRRNNLLLLSEMATKYSNDRIPSLSDFIRYISLQLQSVGKSSGGSKNAVNIMSIHASKGLQFPICIVASTTTKFNDSESRSAAAYSTDFGLGLKYFDEDEHQKYTTIAREVILDNTKQTSLEEELRLLYVAMTRAQDKLNFVLTYNNFEKSLESCKNLVVSSNSKVDCGLFSRTKSYADWLILSFILHPNGKKILDTNSSIIPYDTNSKIDIKISVTDKLEQDFEPENLIEPKPNRVLVDALKENINYSYPFKELDNLQNKVSVSVLANKAESDKYSFTDKPSFLSDGGISAAGRGTAMHKVMEYIDFDNANDIESELDRLCEWQFISENERDSIDIDALNAFFGSDIYTRIKNADRIEREMRFLTEIEASKIDSSLENRFNDEKIVVQGAVDVCFIENGEIVILDFKTDRVEDINSLAECYGEQLSIYAYACEKIFGLPVKEKVIYSFTKKDTVIIK